MVTETFGSVLQELATILNSPPLQSDENNACVLVLDEKIHVQLEMDRLDQFLIIGIDLGGVAATGKYRPTLLREALKANDFIEPRSGILGFSDKTGHLILFESLSVKNLKGEAISQIILKMAEKATLWMEALAKEEIPVIKRTASGASGMFGL